MESEDRAKREREEQNARERHPEPQFRDALLAMPVDNGEFDRLKVQPRDIEW